MRHNVSSNFLLLLFILPGCKRDDMADQPRQNPESPTPVFANGTSARPVVPNTVAIGQLRLNTHLYQGRVNGLIADTFPFPITRENLERGHQQFEIFCSVCHGRLGDGNGMIAQRGFIHPPSFHDQRLRDAPVGHFFDVITNGFGAMYSYHERISPEDRWNIAAYIRALQLSQHANIDDVPESQRNNLEVPTP